MAFSLKGHNLFQCGQNGGTSGNFDTTTGTPDFLAVFVSYQTGSTVVFSDNQSNSFTRVDPVGEGVVGGGIILFYCASPTTSATHTFSVSGSSSFSTIVWQTWTGVKTSGPYDGSVGNGQSGSASTLTTGSISTSAGELILAALCDFANASTNDKTIDSGFTITDQSGFTSSNPPYAYPCSMAYKLQTGSSENPQWSWGTAQVDTNACIATFFGASAAGPNTPSVTDALTTGESASPNLRSFINLTE